MFGECIKKNRLLTGKTQVEVSRATGIPQNTISWIELDKGLPNIEQCIKLADFFNISLDELVEREFFENKKTSADEKFLNDFYSLDLFEQEYIRSQINAFIKKREKV